MFYDRDAILKRTLKRAEAFGASEAEIYLAEITTLRIALQGTEENRDFIPNDSKEVGLAIRVIKGDQLGFTYSSDVREETVDKCLWDSLKASQKVEENEGFPTSSRPTSVKNTFDEDVLELRSDPVKAIEILEMIEQAAKEHDPRIGVNNIFLGAARVDFFVENSSGLSVSDSGTFLKATVTTFASENARTQSTICARTKRRLVDFDADKFGSGCAKETIAYLNPKKTTGGKMPVVLSPEVLTSLLSFSFTEAFCIDRITSKESLLEGKLGTQVVSDKLNIQDDGTYPGGLYTTSIDDEGSPSLATPIIEKGVVKNYLRDSVSGRGEPSTGNCVRWESYVTSLPDDFTSRSYRNKPRSFATNLVVEPGSKTLDDLIGEISTGVYVSQCFPAFTMNPQGEFSSSAVHSYMIRNGEIAEPLRELSIAGNIFELCRNVIEIGKDPQLIVLGEAPICFVSPPISFSEIDIQV